MNGNIRLIGILVLAMVVLAMVQVVGAAPDSQTWCFTNTEASAPIYTDANYNKIMTKGVEGGDDTITLAPGERVWFYADELAECDVGFPAGKWSVSYWVKALNESEAGKGTIYTRLCYVDSGGSYDRVQSRTAAITNPENIEEINEEFVPDAFTVPEGGRLAIEVYWGSSPLGNLEIHCNPSGEHASKATSPSSDPGYPVPELSTLILFSLGLLVLAGYVGLRRKRNK